MKYEWAAALRDKVKAAGLPFMFKQVTAPRSGFGYNALEGKDWHEFPAAPSGLKWANRQPIPEKYSMTPPEWKALIQSNRAQQLNVGRSYRTTKDEIITMCRL